jgi:L-histidine N-alpha-methyltransferase
MHGSMISRQEKSGTTKVRVLNPLDSRYKAGISHDAQVGLTASEKWIPCKYFYDSRGTELFEEICTLPEYYPTRTELSILRTIAPSVMSGFVHGDLVELGSGDTTKIRTLLDASCRHNRCSIRYIPVDISQSAIARACDDLLSLYPGLQVLGIVADFTCQLEAIPIEHPSIVFFLGGTIGNMEPAESMSFLRNMACILGPDDKVMVGFDMAKDQCLLETAYNDSRGVTARFNKNILRVLNSELQADFDETDFDHLAFFNHAESRIEMHLVANRHVQVSIRSIGLEIDMKKGETIHTENSRKFTRENIGEMAAQAGLHVQEWYSDSSKWFSLVLMGRNGVAKT